MRDEISIPINHTKNIFSEALGLSKEHLTKLVFDIFYLKNCAKASLIAEEIDKNFNRRELVFLATHSILFIEEMLREESNKDNKNMESYQ